MGGTTLQIVGEALCEVLDLRSGSTVLDVAAANGNASLAPVLNGSESTSKRPAPRTCPLPISASTSFYHFGVMFTPNQGRAVLEMASASGKTGLRT